MAGGREAAREPPAGGLLEEKMRVCGSRAQSASIRAFVCLSELLVVVAGVVRVLCYVKRPDANILNPFVN